MLPSIRKTDTMSRPSPADPALNIIAQCDAPESGAKDGDVESKSLQLQDESDGKDEKQETDLTTDGGVARIEALCACRRDLSRGRADL